MAKSNGNVVSRMAFRLLALTAGTVAAAATRKALDRGWQRTRGSEPPRNPAAPDTTWTEAVAWAVASGVAIGLARVMSARGAAATWQRATGTLPPGVRQAGT